MKLQEASSHLENERKKSNFQRFFFTADMPLAQRKVQILDLHPQNTMYEFIINIFESNSPGTSRDQLNGLKIISFCFYVYNELIGIALVEEIGENSLLRRLFFVYVKPQESKECQAQNQKYIYDHVALWAKSRGLYLFTLIESSSSEKKIYEVCLFIVLLVKLG